ncbi:hypothetical protein AWH48_20340 [Domibacillus aminovorans]|uniref:Uncharacterized protein n=1 Tax=Domibacillus aminovorans TaxID=29332 RepID=A0A177KNM2_9BACI|nr:hypothetical protein [Domibacillus aminovorans]OAH55028.1 hypothetical protein AWH48_20340 [Domibacillus aminovorans]
MKEEIRKGKTNVEKLLEKPFTLKNTMPASKLREISQRKLKEMIDENEVMGLIIKDEMSITMMGMKEFEELRQYVENLEQLLDEALMVKELGENFFNTSKEQFIKLPENMSASEYREWRKGMRR